MKAVIIYDSVFGNTEKVAQSVGQALGASAEVSVLPVSEATPERLRGADLLIAGAPTRQFRPSDGMRQWLASLPAGALQGMKTAAFDTRMSVKDANVWVLTVMVKIFGYAAEPMAKKLKAKGGQPTGTPAGFLVKGTEGPLFDGELERAAAWAQGLAAN